jgi:predicted protein tyrosine phosphatase
VHCIAGIGRSTAVGIVALSMPGRSEGEIFESIRTLRPQSFPNELLVSPAGMELSRDLSGVCSKLREARITETGGRSA